MSTVERICHEILSLPESDKAALRDLLSETLLTVAEAARRLAARIFGWAWLFLAQIDLHHH